MKSALEITNITTPVSVGTTMVGGFFGVLADNYLAIMIIITLFQLLLNWYYKHLESEHRKLDK